MARDLHLHELRAIGAIRVVRVEDRERVELIGALMLLLLLLLLLVLSRGGVDVDTRRQRLHLKRFFAALGARLELLQRVEAVVENANEAAQLQAHVQFAKHLHTYTE